MTTYLAGGFFSFGSEPAPPAGPVRRPGDVLQNAQGGQPLVLLRLKSGGGGSAVAATAPCERGHP
ncbi:hypothetical protein ACWCPF_42540 [Streptomyces sp. NPDC001858]